MNINLSWLHFELALMVSILSDHVEAIIRKTLSKSEGDNVHFHCNVSLIGLTQINWKKEVFTIFSMKDTNLSYLNSSTERIRVHPRDPTRLEITAIQPSDGGNYSCSVAERKGSHEFKWILHVQGKPNVNQIQQLAMYIVPAAVGGIFLFVCICCVVKRRKRTQHQHSNERSTGTYRQEMNENCHRNARNHRSTYFERMNSVYDGLPIDAAVEYNS